MYSTVSLKANHQHQVVHRAITHYFGTVPLFNIVNFRIQNYVSQIDDCIGIRKGLWIPEN